MNSLTATQHLAPNFPRLMMFDLALGGHHGSYIQHLLEFWYSQKLPGQLNIVVMPEFFTVHRDVVDLVKKWANPRVQLISINPSEAKQLAPKRSAFHRFYRNLQEWQLFRQYAKEYQATQGLILYIDTYEIPLALGLPSPCPFSGIYFRPTFHYSSFTGFKPSKKASFQQMRERFTLNRILRHSQLTTLFCLDPFAVKQIESMHPKARLVHLPDPICLNPRTSITPKSLRECLHIEPQRKVFLLFGALEVRKGIYELLESLTLLPFALNEQLCLVFAGGTSAEEQMRLHARIEVVQQTHPVQIVENYDFISETEVPAYFRLADVVLAPYQKHVGMSGILLWAASMGKPVLSSNYGLMGELVQRYELGLAVDSTSPEAIANGISRCILECISSLSNRAKMKAFAERNSVECFSSTIFQYLYTDFISSVDVKDI